MTTNQADHELQTPCAMVSAVRRRGHVRRSKHAHADESMPPLRSSSLQSPASSLKRRRGFTLTELLIVVAIIAVLASLITAAAINAMRNARRARILLEMRVIAQALEDLRNDVGAYPPNVFPAGDTTTLNLTSPEIAKNLSDVKTFLGKASTRSTENYNVRTLANYGLSPAEALVFWLQGFSSDEQRPLSGSDLALTSIDDPDNPGSTRSDVVTIDSFKPRYDFDRGRLRISRDPPTSAFPDGKARMLEFHRTEANNSPVFYILLYEYVAAGSEKPLIYFDTSRYTPYQMVNTFPTTDEFFFKDPAEAGSYIVPLKRLKQNAPQDESRLTVRQHVEYVGGRKFQILHPGLDDIWGKFEPFKISGPLQATARVPSTLLLYPSGPFTGDVADTLTSFVDGPLADAEESE